MDLKGWQDILLQSLSVGVIMQDADGVIFHCNPAAELLLGRSRREIERSGAIFQRDYSFREDGAIYPEHFYPANMVFKTGRAVRDVSIRVLRPDYSVGWLRVSAAPVALEDGSGDSGGSGGRQLHGVITMLYDMTDQKQMEIDMLRRNDELSQRFSTHTIKLELALDQLELAVNASNTGLWDWDLLTDKVSYSLNWKSQLGYADHEIGDCISEWKERLHPDDRDWLLEAMHGYRQKPAGSLENEYRMRHRNGSYRWMLSRAMAIRNSDGTSVRILGSHIDITERKLAEQSLLRLTQELRDVSRELARVEEAERRRFVQELHDTIGAGLTALSINMTIMRNQLSLRSLEDMESRLNDSISLLDETTDATRHLMAELRPPVLDDYGLAAAIRWQADVFAERNELNVSVDINGLEGRLEPEAEISLFRIVQSALTNISKHAAASDVDIVLNAADGKTTLTITDNGVGFCTDTLAKYKINPTWGLVSMRERAEAVGGSLSIHSSVGYGTTVVVKLESKR
ncbi:PAS domain-containing sensor histidine kinase [Oxalobacteraceae bacterium CAVE-383]|nr:PAS domain-containing sensor histidine kinase [Oxalobacteraceae bacterium CAVE-383]